MPENTTLSNPSEAGAAAATTGAPDFRDKYIASLEEQIQMYKGQLAQTLTQMEKMQEKLGFYETKLHEMFVNDMAAQHGGTSSPTPLVGSRPEKRRLSESETSEDHNSRRSSGLSGTNGTGLYSPAKSDHHRRLSGQSLDGQRPVLPSSQGGRTLPRLSLGFNSGPNPPSQYAHRFSFSGTGPSSGREYYGSSAPISASEAVYPSFRHPGHARHASADFVSMPPQQTIYGWKEGPHGMEPLYPVKVAGPACDGCRIRKRKCGRQKPHCSYCVRLHRNNPGPNPCTYPNPDRSGGEKRQKTNPSSVEGTSTDKGDNKVTDDNIPEVSEHEDSSSAAAALPPSIPKTAPVEGSSGPAPLEHIDPFPKPGSASPTQQLLQRNHRKSIENLLNAAQYTPPATSGGEPLALAYQTPKIKGEAPPSPRKEVLRPHSPLRD